MSHTLTAEEEAFLRDQFAQAAMQGMVSSIRGTDDYNRFNLVADAHGFNKISDWIAHDAYKQADAMLRARG